MGGSCCKQNIFCRPPVLLPPLSLSATPFPLFLSQTHLFQVNLALLQLTLVLANFAQILCIVIFFKAEVYAWSGLRIDFTQSIL